MVDAWRVLSLAAVSVVLVGCGGGGDDDDDAIGAVEDESAVGVWLGTYRLAGMPTRTFNLIAAPSGQFVGVAGRTNQTSTDTRIVVGTGDTAGANVLATGTLYSPEPGATLPNGQASAPISAFSGTVSEGVSLSGTLSAGNETGTFSLTYSAKTNRASSLAIVQGVYANSGSTATLTVTSGGQLTFNTATGCVGNGTIASTDASVNIYSWSLTISNCAAAGSPSGFATLDDFNGAQNNLIALIGSQTDRAFLFSGSK